MVVVWCMHILYMCLIVSKNKFFNWERQSVDHVWFNLSFPYLYIHVFKEIYTVVVVTRPHSCNVDVDVKNVEYVCWYR